MKRGFVFFLLAVMIIAGCRQYKPNDPLLHPLSASMAKSDFAIFKSILKEAHPSLTLYKSDSRIDFIFDSIYNSFTGPVPLSVFYDRLSFITNEIGCSHTNVSLPDYIYDTLQNRKYFFPYPVLLVENKLLINATGYTLPEGTEIVSVNKVPVDQLLQKISIYNSVEGFHRKAQQELAARDFAFQYYQHFGLQSQFDLQIIDTAGHNQTVSEKPITYADWNIRNDYDKYYFDGMAVDYDLEINNKKGFAVIRLPTFQFNGPQKQTAFENFCSNSFE